MMSTAAAAYNRKSHQEKDEYNRWFKIKTYLWPIISIIIVNLLSRKKKILLTKSYNYQTTYFVTSASDIRHLPIDSGIEIVFAGRSNAGKSSALNTLTNQKNLARTSKIPGCTKLINLFEVEPGIRLVDLPGYGYAKVPEELKRNWQHTLNEYLQKRNNIKGLVLLMDIRYPMQDLDQQMVQWAVDVNIPVLILLTKADKLAYSARKVQLNQVRNAAIAFMGDIQVELFSSLKKQGVDKLWQKLNAWFAAFLPEMAPKALSKDK